MALDPGLGHITATLKISLFCPIRRPIVDCQAQHTPDSIAVTLGRSGTVIFTASLSHGWLALCSYYGNGWFAWLVSAGRRVGSQSHTGYADIPGGQRVSLRGRRQRDGPIYVNRAQSRRSMKERDMSFFHPTEIVHSVMSAMTSEPLATFTAGLLILSCLVTGE